MKLTINECYDKIKNADMVLIGLGSDFEPDFKAVLNENPIYKKFKENIDAIGETEGYWLEYAIYYNELISGKSPFILEKLQYINRLSNIIDKKNMFLISTCVLDLVRFSDFPKDRIVTPCGTSLKMECHLGCKKEVYPAIEHYEKIYKKLETMYNNDEFDKLYILQAIPLCEKCEAVMEPNMLNMVSYSEEGYIKEWEIYNKWLSGTVNRNLVMLELGVDFNTPTVIRWPFEKIAMINKKSLLLRVNSKFAMLTPEINETAAAFSMSPFEFIDQMSKI